MKSINISVKSSEQILKELTTRPHHSWEQNYLAHYSSYWDGIVKDPRLMLIPVDDHMVHRGDGVFEAFRSIENKLYLLKPHLERLRISANAIGLEVPWSDQDLTRVIETLVAVAEEPELIFRLYVSRGNGSFSTNPYECPQPHLTIVACRFKPVPKDKYQSGVQIGRSKYIQKPEPYASIKSCNYLPNVLMKKEAVDRNLDFVVAFTDKGLVAESSTENIFLISDSNELLHPRFGSILKGTTMIRTFQLAKSQLGINSREVDITEEMLLKSQEIMMVGTTLDVLPVSRYEDVFYSVGQVGKALCSLIQTDQKTQPQT